MSAKFAERDEEFFCQVLHGVRDFGSTLQPLGVQLSGAFKARKNAKGEVVWTPHAFSYKRRADLLTEEKRSLTSAAGLPGDVFCLVKSYMHDSNLHQPPLLVLPADRLRALMQASPDKLCLREELHLARKEQLLQLADLLEKEEYHYPAAARYIRGLATAVSGRSTQLRRLNWLLRVLAAPAPADMVPSANPYFKHLPEIPWNLLATFKVMASDKPLHG